MKDGHHRNFVAELCLGGWVRVVLLIVGLLPALAPVGFAQTNPPVLVIPIVKERVRYYNVSEDGSRISCGVRLFGSFPVYKGRTNLSDYSVFIPGVQNPGPWRLEADGRFRFFAYFNGGNGPASGNPDCNYSIGETLPDWHAEYRPKPPIASFTSTAVASEPGTWDFLSTSTDAENQPLIEQWVFGDGTDGSGKKVSRSYTKPGNFTVALTVMDTDGLTNRATRSISVPAPKPVVSVRLLNKHSGNRIELEEEFTARVTVQATQDGVGALSNLVFTSIPLSIPEVFTVISAPPETTVGTLQPGGAPRVLDWRLRADKAGQFALTASGVTGRDAAGRTVTGAAFTERGQITALIVGIEQRPPRIVLGADNNHDGATNALDSRLELIVGITNVSKQSITEVKAVIVNDPIQLTSLAQDLNIWITPTNVPPGDFGTIEPGAANAVLRTNVYIATDRTYAEASILLQGKIGETGVQARGEGIVDVGGERLIEARFDVEDRPYNSGQTVRLFGSLKNVTRFVDNRGRVLDPGKNVGVVVYPTIEGNGALGYVFRKGSGGPTPEGPTPFVLAPDESLDIAAIVATAELTTPSEFKIAYDVAAFVFDDGLEPKRAKPSDVEVIEDSGKGWSRSHVVQLSGVPEIPDPFLVCPIEMSFGTFASCRLTEGLGNLGGSLKDLGWLLGSGLKELGVGSYRIVAFDFWAISQALQGLTDPKAAARLAQECSVDLEALKAVGVQSLQGIAVGAEAIGPAIHRSIQNTKSNIVTGNFKQLAGDLSQFVGENPDMALEALVAARAMKKVMLMREGAESVAKTALRESLDRQAAELAGNVEEFAAQRGGSLADLPESDVIPVGINVADSPRVYRDACGTPSSELETYMRIAAEENLLLAWRSRAAKSVEYLKKLSHLLKPHGVSIKTVSEIDIQYLGYPAWAEAECVLVTPPIPWVHPIDPHYQDVIDAFLDRFPDLKGGDAVSKQMRAQVEERLKFQLKEWPDQLANFRKYRKEGIDTNFKAFKQFKKGSLEGKVSELLLPDRAKNFRAARVDRTTIVDKFSGEVRDVYRLLMEDGPKSGNFKPITGDTDLMAILRLDGSLPSLVQRIRVYRKLIKAGMQHGESFSFFIDKMRTKWLRCCSPVESGGAGERMLTATPFGQVLTTQFVDSLSIVEGGANNALKIGEGEFAFLAGTLSAVYAPERLVAETIPAALRTEALPYVSVSVLARMADELNAEIDRDNGIPVRMGADGEPEVYSPTATAGPSPLLNGLVSNSGRGRPAPADAIDDALDGSLRKVAAQGWARGGDALPTGAAGGQWRPVTVANIRPGKPGSGLKIAPYTYIMDDLPAGTSVLPIVSAADLGLPARSPFFAVGDKIVVDPGGMHEEFASIVNVHPFTLSRPLQFHQEVGTTVLYISGAKNSAGLPGALPAQDHLRVWLRADAGVTLNGTNVVSWIDQSPNGYVFAPTTDTTQPSLVTNPVSGVKALRFIASQGDRLVGNLGGTLSNATLFTVCRFVGSSDYVYAFGTRNFSGLMMTLARSGAADAYHYDGAADRYARNAIGGTNIQVFSQTFGDKGPDHHQLYRNLESLIDTRTTTGRAYSAVATNVVLGNYVTGSYYFDGELLEWLVYDRVLSAEERFEVEEYLRQRAGLPPFVAPGSLDLARSEVIQYDASSDPGVNWTSDLANRELRLTGAGDPAITLSDFEVSDQVIRTKIRASAGEGAIGVVFGYQGRGQFHLLDWRQTAASRFDWGTARAGMRVRSFHLPEGQEPTGADFWSGLDPDRVTTLRTSALPWVADREYDVVLRLGAEQTVIEVKFGVTTLATWTIPELKGITGRFGHFANALPDARFGPVLVPGGQTVITHVEPRGDGTWSLRWRNGRPPFSVETLGDLAGGQWHSVNPATLNYSDVVPITENSALFRVRSAGVVTEADDSAVGGGSQTFGNDGRLWILSGTRPTRIEAENFDEGGEGIGYHDTTSQNQLGAYRADGVDIGESGDFGGGPAVGNSVTGEWLHFTIHVEEPGAYRLRARTARGQSGSAMLRFLFNGIDRTGNLVVPPTGSWTAYATVESGVFELAAGAQMLRAEMVSGGFNLNWIEIVPAKPAVQTSFGNDGNPWSIGATNPTRIEAENFDQGGEGVAYHETTLQNSGGAYRAEAVDIATTQDDGGGNTVGGIVAGEWLEYTIQVEKAGTYRLRARTARGQSGTRTVRFLFDGVDKTGNMVVLATGNWESYTTVQSGTFELAAGTQILRADMSSADFNLNWIEIVPIHPIAQAAFGNSGNPLPISSTSATRIEAENFDEGGPDVAYRDTDPANQGGAYRIEDVDIQPTTDIGGGFNVSWIEPGEWLEYTMDVAVAGTYQLRFRTARAPAGSSTLRVLVDDVDKTGNVTIPRTVGAQTWTTVTKTGVNLNAGVQTLRLEMVVGGFNLNWIEIVPPGL